MSFLTSNPDLSNTIFTENDLRIAREYLESGIRRAYPAWLKKPQGVLGKYWLRDDTEATCFLIDFAQRIYNVDRNITERSVPIFHGEKIKERLLRAKIDEQFLENLTELQAASVLVNYASPLSLDPTVSEEDLLAPSNRPRTPDFGLRLPDNDVLLEVTVCHIDVLDQLEELVPSWEKVTALIRTTIEEQLVFAQHRSLHVEIHVPLQQTIDEDFITDLLSKMEASQSGVFPVGSTGRIEWKPLPINIVQDGLPRQSSIGIFHAPGVIVDPGCIIQRKIAPVSKEKYKQIINSIRYTLDRKRKQFRRDMPSVLILRLAQPHLARNGFFEIVHKRIWPNNKVYDWLTGICLLIPRQGFRPSDAEDHITFSANPEASYKASSSLMSLFKGTEQFHLP